MDQGHSHQSDWSSSLFWNLYFYIIFYNVLCMLPLQNQTFSNSASAEHTIAIAYISYTSISNSQNATETISSLNFPAPPPPPRSHTSSKLIFVMPTQMASIFQPNHFNLLDTALWMCSNLHTGYTYNCEKGTNHMHPRSHGTAHLYHSAC